MQLGLGSLADLARLRAFRRRRLSSWDRTGGNKDALLIEPGATISLGEIPGAGCVKHLWVTLMSLPARPHDLCTTVLRAFWDGESSPSVEAPIGDFFGMGFGRRSNFCVAAAADEPRGRQGLQLLVPDALRERRAHRGREPGRRGLLVFYYYVDYEEYDALEGDLAPLPRELEPAQPDRRPRPGEGLDPPRLPPRRPAAGGRGLRLSRTVERAEPRRRRTTT